ncbi:NADH-quinone oxidoreductase subunit H [Ktedonobacter sp. SOSP1-52]|uniref:complex I subunit 1/NuoH family protein n=1 Tax=Ktedonobacter sp. SOSP1-52 TaxID=2778366 RepID=UPI00191643E9|nr:complex I subunit 1 family protein [Ktedonobacter sp. SOSP1-52]GHO66480.1 NADH-quinone oxidoreductase subunit H [Ktedonobacter sp. SOSP1-52]
MFTVLADDGLWTQLVNGILSWDTLQFVVAFLSIFGFVLTSATILVLLERKVIAWVQDRLGPYHTGPYGLLQSVADVLKLLLKEDVHTADSDLLLFWLAPAVFLAPAIATFAVLPFSPYIGVPGTALATGVVYYVAISSIDVVGVVMAGWSSNNKYALIGGLRAAAQMISYELPLFLSLVGVIMLTSVLAGHPGYPGVSGIGTVSLREIQNFQNIWSKTGNPVLDFLFEGFTPWAWFILVQPLMILIYYTCGLAETNRAPFDLPEAESELVAGHMTEYSGMRWAMFFLGEYGNMTVVSAITAYMFLGGFAGPGVSYLVGLNNIWWGLVGNLLGLVYLVLKVYLLCFVFIWIRATLPRLRADQLMQFSWLILMPVTLANIIVTGGVYLIFDAFHFPIVAFLVTLGVINWISVYGFIQLVHRATVASTRRAQAPAIRAQRRAAAVAGLQLRDGVPARAQLTAGGSEK